MSATWSFRPQLPASTLALPCHEGIVSLDRSRSNSTVPADAGAPCFTVCGPFTMVMASKVSGKM
jgi:hypothetical protein